ncbi:hypothetical protein B0H14DRAFT_2610720 [Mycena olivaceomarginata]|nr:hypothetical protein B0H14DRAFT_2610720 [Mycena olivaceomarginata]
MRSRVGLGVVSTLHSPFTPLAVRRADSLPGSSPIPTSPVHPSHSEDSRSEDSGSEGSGNEDETPKNSALPVLPPLSSDGPSAEERKAAVFEEVLETLSSNGLSFGQLMLYVFDPVYKQGVVRWKRFFKHQELATQVLNLWVSNQNSPSARQEVGMWAEDYVAEAMCDEAQGITGSKKLQTADNAINNDYVTNFSMLPMGTYFQTAARISMRFSQHLRPPPRNLKSGLVQCAEKHFTIITAATLSLLGEFSRKNNFFCHIISLYLYATVAQRQTILVMSHLGILESYWNLIHSLRVMINRCRRVVNLEDNPPRIPPGTPSSGRC